MTEKILINRLTPKGKNNLRLFFRFLKENHCFYKYLKAFHSCKHNDVQSFQNFCNTQIDLILSASFVWGETEEGYYFWINIHKRFITLIRQLEGIAK